MYQLRHREGMKGALPYRAVAFPFVNRGPDLSWIKDWRVGTLAGGCLLAGFLLGLLIFGAPWHLPPDWGDVPTWLLVVLGAVGGWVALYQLRILRQQFVGELQRTAKRDELLDRQLAEAQARAVYERRWQAEDIEVKRWAGEQVFVDNNSRRPISDIVCRILSKAGGLTVAEPIETFETIPNEIMGGDRRLSPRLERLRPSWRCVFRFDGAVSFGDEHISVTWFTDDAGIRWQLDEYLHLAQAEDEDKYRP